MGSERQGSGTAQALADGDSAYRPGYELAGERILEYIAKQGFKPGDRLPTEAQLSQIIGVSRTVAREAVKVLSALGRVKVRKGAGIYVAAPQDGSLVAPPQAFLPADLDHVEMLFEYRKLVETSAAELAAARATPLQVRAIVEAAVESETAADDADFAHFRQADERFHNAVAAGANNIFLISALRTITDLKRQVLTLGMKDTASGSLAEAARQHRLIADGIRQGDSRLAAEAMTVHVDVARDQFRAQIQRTLRDAADADRTDGE